MIGAIDIGGTKVAVGLVDPGGTVLAKSTVRTADVQKPGDGLSHIDGVLRRLARDVDAPIDGIGIGCTGRVDAHGALTRNDFLPEWSGANLPAWFSLAFGVPAAIENDADAAALAEAAWGAGARTARFIYVSVGTGIGGGIVLDGRLYRGVGGAHPEIGHHVIDPRGPACYCGANGCWEQFASGSAMAGWALANDPEARVPPPDAQAICALAERGDPRAQRCVQREGYYLGLGLANLITLFAPEMIALGGGLMQRWDLFADQAQQVIQRNCGLVPFRQTQVTVSTLGPDAGLLGAARAWFARFA